jgi:serine/threonine-protein kinase RsbW
MEAEMTALGYQDKDVFAVKLVLGEAIVNAVRHGNRGDEKKRVQVTYQVTRNEVIVEVLDEGAGFNPALVPDPRLEENLDRPGGRGLFLMQVYMSWVRFNERGNGVTFCRQRSGVGRQN